MRVLAVDDDQDFLDLLGEAFSAQGIDCALCTSGHEALRRIDSEDFDVALLDLVMPRMDGRALARRIRERPRTGGLPIVMMTNISNVLRIDPATPGDANHYVSKSGAFGPLVDLVQSLSGRRTR